MIPMFRYRSSDVWRGIASRLSRMDEKNRLEHHLPFERGDEIPFPDAW
jgi:hypothetical protein